MQTASPAPTNTSQPTVAPTQTASPAPTDTPVPTSTPTEVPAPVSAPGIRVMRVEYANYANSRGEVTTWKQKMDAAGINLVALAAGRLEWAYFKWGGHESDWSNDVKGTGIDFLAEDSAQYGQNAQVNAVIDVFAPNYISAHPDRAAVNVLGERSSNLISTAELVNGEFGQKLLDMVGYIAANYPNVDSISITELSYRIDGYGDDDLALYSSATGRSDWPRQSNGQVDIDDSSIGNWRSAVLGQYLGRATAIAHQYGKQLFMDVGLSVGNLNLMTNNKGTNYNAMLQNVDKIVVWDYFGEDGFPPEYSRDIAQFLTQFGVDRVILSVGLWGASSGSIVSANDFRIAVQASMDGAMPNIWICPGSMMSSDHWQVLNDLWGNI
ncbi:MAG: PT domain-containing protein [Chloroflexota bacterium]